MLRDLPATLTAFCSDGAAGRDEQLRRRRRRGRERLAAKPVQGKVLAANGRTVSKRSTASAPATLLDADLNPGLAAELPAVVHSARLGNMQPLLRLVYLHDLSSDAVDRAELRSTLATVCRDGPFPWSPDTPLEGRAGAPESAVAALPAGTFGPFGSWAYRFGNADFCLGWPSPAGGAPPRHRPASDVPMLAISGGFDMRTPTEGAGAVVSRFPHGQLLVVPGVGHSTVTADPSGCALQAVRTWMLGGPNSGQCPRSAAPGADPRAARGRPAAQGEAGAGHVLDRLEDALRGRGDLADGSRTRDPGVFAGKLAPGPREFTLTRYAAARGVSLTGTLRLTSTNLPLNFQGTVTVAGPSASNGILGLNGTSLRGTLGGRIVGR